MPYWPHPVPAASVMAAARALAQSPSANQLPVQWQLPVQQPGSRQLPVQQPGSRQQGNMSAPLTRTAADVQQRQAAAAMAAGITGAAARAGAVPDATRAAAMDSSGNMPAAGQVQGAKRGKRQSSKAGAATSIPQFSIPPYSSLNSLQQLWDLYDKGDSMTGMPPWRVLEEQHKSRWRPKGRRRWAEVLAVVEGARERAVSETTTRQQPFSAEQAVQQMEEERQQLKEGINTYIKRLYKQRSAGRAAEKAAQAAAAAAAAGNATAEGPEAAAA